MEKLVLASTGADADAAHAMTSKHSELTATMAVKTLHLLNELDAADVTTLAARDELAAWCRASLMPYLQREAEILYPALPDTAEAASVAESLKAGLAELTTLTGRIAELTDRSSLGACAVSLRSKLTSHLETEDSQLLPFLAFSRGKSISLLWKLLNERTPMENSDQSAATHADGTACTCGEKDEANFPPLDVRAVPHAIRHGVVFGALDAVQPQAGIVLIAPHDPLPLLAQIEQRTPGRFSTEYLVRKPAEVHIRLTRVA